MALKRKNQDRARGGVTIQLSITALVIICVSLVLGSGLLTYGMLKLTSRPENSRGAAPSQSGAATAAADVPPAEAPPWGELLVREIELEQPEEYIATEAETNRIPTWFFVGATPEEARDLMQACGLSPDQTARALSPQFCSVQGSNTVIHPDDDLVISLAPETRAALYAQLARADENHYIRYPFCYPGQSIDTILRNPKLDPNLVALIRKLLYRKGDAEWFSDLATVLRRIPSETERLDLVKDLSRQPALIARLRVRPNTDIDKALGYWSRGIQVKDVRPLLESLTQLPDGGSLSILHLLPPFARQRLYTFPLPSRAGEHALDCHWSTLNFFNEVPDDRFAEAQFASQYVNANFYQIAKPSLYGDVIFFMNDRHEAIHSVVYLADDIVFTKNGNNYTQPWMLMRLNDVIARFTTDHPPQVVVYRNKNW